MSAATAQALRDEGGTLYVWADGAGLPRTRTSPPTAPTDFATFNGDGWAVHIERAIKPPLRWAIKRKRFPWPRFVAVYNPSDADWGRVSLGDIVSAIASEPWS